MPTIKQIVQKAIRISNDSSKSISARRAAMEVVQTLEDFPPNESMDLGELRQAMPDVMADLTPKDLGF